jgi:hypothetical protein
MDSKQFVCPMPQVWNRIWQRLQTARERFNRPEVPSPPTPLILNGWVFSSDADKERRWKETVKWAKEYGLYDEIPELNEYEQYLVSKITEDVDPGF